MKRALFSLAVILLALNASAQTRVTAKQVPESVKTLVTNYITAMQNAPDVDAAIEAVIPYLGGVMLKDGAMATMPKQYTFPKDYKVAKAYAVPVKIDHAQMKEGVSAGNGDQAITGTQYRVYILPKNGGFESPVQVILPADGDPKITSVGSLKG